jgi:flavoprotein
MGTFETDTRRCCHCGKISLVRTNDPLNRDKVVLGGQCRSCDDWICNDDACNTGCDYFMRKIERAEARDRSIRSILG